MGRLVSRIVSLARRSLLPATAPDRPGRGLLALTLAAAALILPAPPAAHAATPPSVTSTSVSEVTETSATLRGKIDSGAKKTEYRFEYITLAAYKEDGESFGEGTVSVPLLEPAIPNRPKAKGDLTNGSTAVTNLTVLEGALDVGQAITVTTGIQPETTIAALDLDAETLTLSKPATATATVELLTTGPQPVFAPATGLAPGTTYRLRLSAHHGAEAAVHGQTVSFATLAPAPAFGPCPNDLLRSGGPGVLLPPGAPSASLPDCRAYEQVSPTEKDGADAVGDWNAVFAAPDGQAATFLSSFGAPGGEGSQTIPTFLAARSAAGWSSSGLLPPAAAGNVAHLIGWSPDFSLSLTEATRLAAVGRSEAALFLREGAGPPRPIIPYLVVEDLSKPLYSFIATTAEETALLFESRAALPPAEGAEALPGAVQGASNVYAYDLATGELSLAAQMNSLKETEALLPHGAFAGPYAWDRGSDAPQLNGGGASAQYYLKDTHAVSEEGDLFFTAAGSGQLYQRVNPTEPQSPLNGAGECEDPALACTYHVSATHKTNGEGTEDGSDPAGPAPAAFMAASANGEAAFFTSPEKLTDDANTGPEQPPAQIGRAKIGAEEAEEVEEGFLPAHALGIAVSPDGTYLYWADPSTGTIDRAKLNGSGEPGIAEVFIEPGKTKAENFPEKEPGVFHYAPSTPRYVALGPCAGGGECVYWTNTGPLGVPDLNPTELEPILGAGSIGRAELDASGDLVPESIDPEFIHGSVETGPGEIARQVTDPQGIAVNSEHIYWANSPNRNGFNRTIARAAIGGGTVEPKFRGAVDRAFGVALDGSHVYYSDNDENNNRASVERVGLEGGEAEGVFVGKAGMRGVAVDAGHVYWASRSEAAIGRIAIGAFKGGACETTVLECEKKFIAVSGAPSGMAVDAAHLYWSVNGEAPSNPGNDLYRFQRPGSGGCEEPQGCLTDLSADPEGDGAEALGVLGASEDGSYVYFVANGALTDDAEPGDCHTRTPHGSMSELHGQCNLYLDHEGGLQFIARLDADSGIRSSDARDWVPIPITPAGGDAAPEAPRLATVSDDGRSLLFASREKLTAYDNRGVPEFYLFRPGHPLACLTCNPTGAAPTAAPTLAESTLPTILAGPGTNSPALLLRNLSDQGTRFFFQSSEALVGSDTDGAGGCPAVLFGPGRRLHTCQDVYQWEAPGAGTCTESSSSYSAQDEGCIYLLSPGSDAQPAFFADADETGDNVFFFTRSRLVGQDQDQLFDLYDARAEGGLASQNPLPPAVCEGEACKPAATDPPPPPSPATPNFHGPGNARPPAPCPRGRVRRHGHCATKHHKRHKKHHRHSRRAVR